MNAATKPMATILVANATSGYCVGTSYSPSDCSRDQKGGYALKRSQTASWEAAFAACRERCAGCDGCHFFSFSKKHSDCSWFRSCPSFDERKLHREPNGFVTVRVLRAPPALLQTSSATQLLNAAVDGVRAAVQEEDEAAADRFAAWTRPAQRRIVDSFLARLDARPSTATEPAGAAGAAGAGAAAAAAVAAAAAAAAAAAVPPAALGSGRKRRDGSRRGSLFRSDCCICRPVPCCLGNGGRLCRQISRRQGCLDRLVQLFLTLRFARRQSTPRRPRPSCRALGTAKHAIAAHGTFLGAAVRRHAVLAAAAPRAAKVRAVASLAARLKAKFTSVEVVCHHRRVFPEREEEVAAGAACYHEKAGQAEATRPHHASDSAHCTDCGQASTSVLWRHTKATRCTQS